MDVATPILWIAQLVFGALLSEFLEGKRRDVRRREIRGMVSRKARERLIGYDRAEFRRVVRGVMEEISTFVEQSDDLVWRRQRMCFASPTVIESPTFRQSKVDDELQRLEFHITSRRRQLNL